MNTEKIPISVIWEQILHEWKFITTKSLQLSNWWSWDMVSRNGNKKAVAAIIRHKDTGNIILIDQYRFPVQRRVIELVAGICDKEMSPEEIMREEVKEEVGYSQIEDIQYLFELSSSAGLTSETTYLYSIIVSGERGEQTLEELEDINVHEVKEEDFEEFLEQKKREWMIFAGNVLSALYFSSLHLKRILESNQ